MSTEIPQSRPSRASFFDRFPRVNVMGIPIAKIDLEELLRYVGDSVRSAPSRGTMPRTIAYANVHSCILFHDHPEYREALLPVNLVYTDGNGPRVAAWLAGEYLPPRMTGADWFDELCSLCAYEGFSLYLLGAAPGVASKASEVIRRHHPGLVVLGQHHGYFSQEEELEILRSIRELSPDILVLGMGSPRQEIWMTEKKRDLPVPVIWAAGGVFDYASGRTRRVPLWIRKLALEWLGRVFMDPRRLGPRYMRDIPLFVSRSLADGLKQRLKTQ